MNEKKEEYTEKNLFLEFAKVLSKQKDSKSKMLTVLKHLPVDDQLEFLEKRGHLTEAAKLMLETGEDLSPGGSHPGSGPGGLDPAHLGTFFCFSPLKGWLGPSIFQ